MPTPDAEDEAGIRREIEAERRQLVHTLNELRTQADLMPKLRERLPLLLAGALSAGFVLGGGIGATMRLLMRRSREGTEKAKLGRFTVAERR